MRLVPPAVADALRPTEAQALDAWAARVRADRAQVERAAELEPPEDHYAPVAQRFVADPGRTDDPILKAILGYVRPGDAWLDVGAGAGRYALPLARRTRAVTALEPSPSMRAQLLAGIDAHAVAGVEVVDGSWPDAQERVGTVDGVLMAHVGYLTEDIGPFLDAAETVARRVCVAVGGVLRTRTLAAAYWQTVHGEPRLMPPAIPELLALLIARGRFPEIRTSPRGPVTFATFEDLLEAARRQLRVRSGSAKDDVLRARLESDAVEGDDGWSLEAARDRIAVLAWMVGEG